MRRGLISWSREEVPPSVLDHRVARFQEKIQAAKLDAVLVYTSFARPSAVAWLTHFVPYWNEALLVIQPSGAPVLLAAFSKRVHDWIRSVSHLGEVRSAPDLRADATLCRLEGDALLGERYAVELSIAYKATWVRFTRCIATQAVPQSWRSAADRFVETVERLNEANRSLEPGKNAAWALET